MQHIWKLFKWNNGNNRTDLTNYLVAPIFLERRCNEQLSTGEVVLDIMPMNLYSVPFLPKTKFTLERWENETLVRYFDYVVDHDDVEYYAGLPEYNCHRIHLIEPSVYAQGLHCDNFALTYEQNDSTLNYKTVISSKEKAIVNDKEIIGNGYERPNWDYGGGQYAKLGAVGWFRRTNGDFTFSYINSFSYRWTGLEAIKDFRRNLNGLVENVISFTMPIAECYANNGTIVAEKLFDCPTRCMVTRSTLKNGVAVAGTTITVASHLYSPVNIQNRNDRLMYNVNGLVGLRRTQETSYTEQSSGLSNAYAVKVFRESEIVNFPAMVNTNDASKYSRMVSFITTALTPQDFANKLSYEYKVNLVIEPYQSGAIVSQYTAKASVAYIPPIIPILFNSEQSYEILYTSLITPSPSSCTATVSFLCRNLSEAAPSNPFLIKGQKYNCFELFRRAMLTCDTRILDNTKIGLDEKYDANYNDIGIQYPIEISRDWLQRIKETAMQESVFENKNLWEVMQQIGHYLHAIPYLEFARNGKEQFALKFKQLGSTRRGNNESIKLTVFNSQNLDNFFTQYDSYVTNLFSPQNEIDEWLVCKTSDSSYLVSNETAELHTKYNITELIDFDIIYDGIKKSALEYVFEKSVYDTLSARTNFEPAKWLALYFSMGTSKILGLNYVPPTAHNDGYMALKTIVGKLFSNEVTDKSLKFNGLKFHVRYKTQDSLRLTQIRPDLERFMKSSEFEVYPHHEQFFGQQDKIVDSERFSANLWGRLIRVANGVYQCQEYAQQGQEKEPGDLINLYGSAYYITECENEYYADAIFQKVTYSKNFNQLSNIVTIPSEPRFFEVSERSVIRREIRLLDFIKLTTLENTTSAPSRFINSSKWHAFLRNLMFADKGNPQLPNFAYMNYKADLQRLHYNLPNNDASVMFPSCEAAIVDGIAQPNPSASNRSVIVPILHFPLRNAIVFEWDMDDNFKAGDCIDSTTSGKYFDEENKEIADKAYLSLQPVRYCDVYGRADLFDFKLFYKDNWTAAQAQRLPFAEDGDFVPTAEQSMILIPDNLAVGLDKDNREALSFNYQLNLLHAPNENDTEDFVIFSNLFGKKNARLKALLLNSEISMFNEVVKMDTTTIVADDIQYAFTNLTNGLRIDFLPPLGVDLSTIKSIVLYDTENAVRYAYIAKNLAKLPNVQKLQSWWIYPVFSK